MSHAETTVDELKDEKKACAASMKIKEDELMKERMDHGIVKALFEDREKQIVMLNKQVADFIALCHVPKPTGP